MCLGSLLAEWKARDYTFTRTSKQGEMEEEGRLVGGGNEEH